MARGRSPGYEDQREMILEHAAQLFANRGYSATSMNQVAEACGFSKALLYHYYRDKYSLLVSIAENHVSRLEGLVTDVESPADIGYDTKRKKILIPQFSASKVVVKDLP